MKPVFIGGCSRSGTTLLGHLLGLQKNCIDTPESQFKIEWIKFFNSDPFSLNCNISVLEKNIRFLHWEINNLHALLESSASYSDFILKIVNIYSATKNISESEFWIDHTPRNINYANTLLDLFPDARFIHIIRDVRAVSASLMPLDWGPNTASESAKYWLESIAPGLALEIYKPQIVKRVHFENLIKHPEHTIADICTFCNIEFNGINITNDVNIPDYTKNQHALIGKKPDISRIDGWKKILTIDEIKEIEFFTCEILKYLGYDTLYNPAKLNAPGFFDYIYSFLNEQYSKNIKNPIMKKFRIKKYTKK